MRKQILTFVADTGSAMAGRVPMQRNGAQASQAKAWSAVRKQRTMSFGRAVAARFVPESGLCSVDTGEAGPP